MTARHVSIPKDILVASVARERRNRLVCSIGTFGERYDYEFEPSGRIAVPGAVERHVEVAEGAVEFAVDGSRVSLENERRANSLCFAGCVVEGAVRRECEGISDFKSRVCKVAGLPYGPTCWIPVPLVIGLGNVADVVKFFGWVVDVHVSGYSVDCAGYIISAVFDPPKHVVSIERHSDLVSQAVTCVPTLRNIVVAPARNSS